MKFKILFCVVIAIFCLLFVGCDATQPSDTGDISSPSSAVESTAPATVTLVGESTVTLEVGSEYIESGAVSDDGSEVIVTGEVDTLVAGDYVITYSDGKTSVNRTVKVTDSKSPTVKLNGSANMTVSAEKLFKDPGVTATDNSSSKLKITSKRSAVKGNSFTVTYTVTDNSGNKATIKRNVTIKDIVKPTITLTGGADIYIEKGTKYSEFGFSAKDDLDGDLTSSVKVSGRVDTATSGAYTITYSVTDKAGNATALKRIVHIFTQQSECPDRVYLTFDDGPTSSITPKVLDALKRNNVKATFFIINYSESRKPLVKRIVDEGHTLAIHAYSHDYKTCYSSASAYMQGLETMRAKILADTGYDARIIRFPGGTSNAISKQYCRGVMTELARRTVEAGYSYFDWNVDSKDASTAKTASAVYNNVVGGLRRGRNNVVLMHDSAYKNATADSLDKIINYCKANGYAVLPITQDTTPVRHKPNN